MCDDKIYNLKDGQLDCLEDIENNNKIKTDLSFEIERVKTLIDDDLKKSVGTLIYYEKEKACIIELEEFLDEWNAPLLFSGLVKKGIYTLPQAIKDIALEKKPFESRIKSNVGQGTSYSKWTPEHRGNFNKS